MVPYESGALYFGEEEWDWEIKRKSEGEISGGKEGGMCVLWNVNWILCLERESEERESEEGERTCRFDSHAHVWTLFLINF